MTRVLMFGWDLPPLSGGGVGTACLGLTRALAQLGADVTLVVPHPPGDLGIPRVRVAAAPQLDLSIPPRAAPAPPAPHAAVACQPESPQATAGHLRIRAIESPLSPYLTQETYTEVVAPPPVTQSTAATASGGAPVLPELHARLGTDLFTEVFRYGKAAESLAAQEPFDIIHAHDWMTIPAALATSLATGRPYVLHIHSLETDRAGSRPDPTIFEIEKLGMACASHVVAVSDYTRQIILRRYGIAPDRVSVVHNAVSRTDAGSVYHVRRRQRQRTVLFLGRITAQKGPDYFVEAAALVAAAVPDTHFVMAGSGDMLPRIVERVAELRLGGRFTFTGALHGADVERMYAASDLYVMPSVSEPFGLAPLEAMLYDVPVIISRQSGVAEVLHHALTVDFWDVAGLAAKIIAVLKYPVLARELVRNSREELKGLRWESAAAKVLSIYRRLTG